MPHTTVFCVLKLIPHTTVIVSRRTFWRTFLVRYVCACCARRSWQVIPLSEPRVVVFVRITGTRNTANEVFHCVHFECPADPQAIAALQSGAPENATTSPNNSHSSSAATASITTLSNSAAASRTSGASNSVRHIFNLMSSDYFVIYSNTLVSHDSGYRQTNLPARNVIRQPLQQTRVRRVRPLWLLGRLRSPAPLLCYPPNRPRPTSQLRIECVAIRASLIWRPTSDWSAQPTWQGRRRLHARVPQTTLRRRCTRTLRRVRV